MLAGVNGPLVVEHCDDSINVKLWLPYRVRDPFDSQKIIEVPAGYVTDFASIPRGLWNLIPPWGRYRKAAVVHDWLCDYSEDDKHTDYVFLKLMQHDGIGWIRYVLFAAVRMWWFWCAGIRAFPFGEHLADNLGMRQVH